MSDAALEIARLRAALAAETAHSEAAESDLVQVRATVSCSEAMTEELKPEAAATEDTLATEQVPGSDTTTVKGFARRKPARKPFPEHLPREKTEVEAPTSRGCCRSGRIVKIGEDITETLEVMPRQWKVIQQSGKSSRVGIVKRSASRPHLSTPSGADGPGPA